MRISKPLLASFIMAALIPATAGAIVLGGSNLGFGGYPEPSCSKPYSKPRKPYSFNSQWEVDSYNREVERYNQDLRTYQDCVVEYLENAGSDMKRIREAMDDAVADAKRDS